MTPSIAALEQAEIAALTDLYRAAVPAVAEPCGLSVQQVGEATVIAASRVDVLALNRVLGLGLHGAVSDDQLDEVLETIQRLGAPRFFVPVAPVGEHEALVARLERRGLPHYNNWVRLSREVADLPSVPASGLDVRPVGPTEASLFGQIVSAAFGYPPAIAPLAAQAVGRASWRHYLAYDGPTPVAAAAMYIAGPAAWLGFAGTAAEHRGRGAQQILVGERLRVAAAVGCRWVSVETAEDSLAKAAPSFRNLRRLGFEVAYLRPNHVWTRAARTA
ncbi:MAG: hypothetical protein ACT4QD_21445 [Acidobacteriota bacterium]